MTLRENSVLIENRGGYTVNPVVGFVRLGVKDQPIAGIDDPTVGVREGGREGERIGTLLDSEER